MRLYASALVFAFMLVTAPNNSAAASVASFPIDWQDWPVVARHQIYSTDTILPEDASAFFQESVYAYTWMNNGQGSPLTIRVNPNKMQQYQTHGPYTDGITVVAIAEASNIVWVTEHLGGFPIYGSYNLKGEDVSDDHPSLAPDFCHSCHNTYKDICINGTCFTPEP
ncbi:hypothetical protein GCM10007916_20240 [Psychromonas marina]|uniref:Cytochrome P460 domain-containing protein n=2 Tax=Psychromonas marina TaxID=88364 RepID=A0ABQ6E0T9_9GAMM|nr:hypothetical protein GCM10007916_20240 [Psychromonas marina]